MFAPYLYGGSRVKLPPLPTRDQLARVKESFNSLWIDTPSYGRIAWWETIAWFPNRADRQAAYAAKRANGDTHIILDLSGSYREISGLYNNVGADYSQNLSALVKLAYEVLEEGFLIDLRLAGDGQGAGPGYNDPVGMTYGHDWLMANLDRIMDAFAPIYRYIVWTPGYDGVFYGWTPEQCMAFAARIRARWSDAVIGIEFNTAHIPLGEGGGDYLPGGRMQNYDVIFGEFDPFDYHSDSTWQIVGRLVPDYHRPPDQPSSDDPLPPHYLSQPSPRGPFYFIPFEILTYRHVRGAVPDEEYATYRDYFTNMGCELVSK